MVIRGHGGARRDLGRLKLIGESWERGLVVLDPLVSGSN